MTRKKQSVHPGRVKPKADENDVVAAVWPPGEEIGLDEAHPLLVARAAAMRASRGTRPLRSRRSRGAAARWSTRRAQASSGRCPGLESFQRFGQLAAAGKVQALTQIVGPAPGSRRAAHQGGDRVLCRQLIFMPPP